MRKLTTEVAQELKRNGYTHIAAVVKSYGRTEYFNVHSIDEIMDNGGKWLPCIAGFYRFRNGSYGNIRIGIIGSQIYWKHTIRASCL